MALIESGRAYRITASGGGTLTAPANASYRVRDIHAVPSSNDTYIDVGVGGRTVGRFRAAGKAGNHVPFPAQKTTQLFEATRGGLLAWLRARGIDLTIPVPTGYGLTVTRYAETGNVVLVYDRYTADEVKPDETNGPEAKVQRYLHYLTNPSAITATPVELSTSLQFSGGDQWPVGGAAVPAGVTYRLLGVLACPVARGNNTVNKGYTTHLTLSAEGDILFDSEDNQGIPFLGVEGTTADAETYAPAGSLIGPMTGAIPYPALLFDPAVVFPPGRKLTVSVVVAAAAAAGMQAASQDVALILEKSRGA